MRAAEVPSSDVEVWAAAQPETIVVELVPMPSVEITLDQPATAAGELRRVSGDLRVIGLTVRPTPRRPATP